MKAENISFIIHPIVGAAMGALSFYLNDYLYALIATIAIFLVLKYPLDMLTKEKHNYGWYLANGGALYFFLWFIIWILLFNIYPLTVIA